MDENIGQGYENQGRSFRRLHAEGKAGRKYDHPCQKSHEGIQRRNAHRFSGERMVTAHVAGKDFHGALSHRQSEESLVHGCCRHIADARFHSPVPVRQKVELQPLSGARQKDAVHRQNHNEPQKAQHHTFRHLFQTFGHAAGAHQKSHQYIDAHENHHFHRIRHHAVKGFRHLLRRKAVEGAVQKTDKIIYHPPGNGGVVHHEDKAPQKAHPAMDMPPAALRLQGLKAPQGTLVTGPSYSQLHGHHRYAQ